MIVLPPSPLPLMPGQSMSNPTSPIQNSPSDSELDAGEVKEVAPPTPGASVVKDEEHPYAPTPKRTKVTVTTPAAQEKKSGCSSTHPINMH